MGNHEKVIESETTSIQTTIGEEYQTTNTYGEPNSVSVQGNTDLQIKRL